MEDRLVEDVRAGLARLPRSLPCRWLYDEEGSRLFDEICRVPEYYIPAAEREILSRHADDILASAPPEASIVELGSGSAEKTRLLFDAALRDRPHVRYVPIDISASALETSSARLRADYPGLIIQPVCAEYEDGLQHLGTGPRLVVWLGSNIGNFDRAAGAAFLRRVGARLAPRDRLLVGIDRRKGRDVLELAYDDPAGVTARFSKNVLRRLNDELGADFDVDAFRHRAVYDPDAGRVSMYLVSERAQNVRIPGVPMEISLAAGEAIHTEDSYKYSDQEVRALAAAAGLRIERMFTDRAERFYDVVFSVAPRSSR